MKSNSSGRLQELMEYYGISRSDIIEKTGIPKSALSMYLSGHRVLRQDRLSDIAEAYNVNEAWLMGYDVPMKKNFSTKIENNYISEDDKLLSDFHSLDSQGKSAVRFILDNELKRIKKENELESKLFEIKKSNNIVPTRIWAYYGKLAAAGKSADFNDMIAGTKEFPVTDENRCADYTIGVSGDSMEPTFYDGDIVFVKRTDDLNVGDIGIFQKDNSIYIKEVGESGLISHNPKYPIITTEDRIICMGKVIAKA